jgi:hypothetical protein
MASSAAAVVLVAVNVTQGQVCKTTFCVYNCFTKYVFPK